MPESFSQTVTTSWRSRIFNALAGVVFAPIAMIAGSGVLVWNEGNVVKRAQSLDEGERQVVTIAVDKIDPANAGKLVHTTGETSVAGELTDQELGISAPAIKLLRVVEMYQWKERKETKRRNNRKTTTYHYDRKWLTEPVSSRSFEESGHENPGVMPLHGHDEIADEVRLGAFRLSTNQVAQIDQRQPRLISPEEFAAMPENVRRDAVQEHGELFLPVGRWLPHAAADRLNPRFKPAADPGTASDPQIGDVRLRYFVVLPGPATVVGRQTGEGFDAFPTKTGKLLEFRTQTMTAAEMFDAARADNTMWAWILRGVGLAVIFAGFMLLTAPLSALADWVPVLGSLVSGGMLLLAIGGTLIVGSLVISVAWLAYHPLFALGLLVTCVLLAAVIWYLFPRRRPVVHDSGLEIVR